MILLMCGIFVLAVDFGNDMSLAPQTAIFEQIICRNLGLLSSGAEAPPSGNPPVNGSDPCKSEAVQAELALVLGYKDMFEVLPSIVLSLPYGVLSDHWGRKPVIFLGVVGLLLGEVWVRLVGKLESFNYSPSPNLQTRHQLRISNLLYSAMVKCAASSAGLVVRIVQSHRGRRPGAHLDCVGDDRRHFF
jgi:hypothetical protein